MSASATQGGHNQFESRVASAGNWLPFLLAAVDLVINDMVAHNKFL